MGGLILTTEGGMEGGRSEAWRSSRMGWVVGEVIIGEVKKEKAWEVSGS